MTSPINTHTHTQNRNIFELFFVMFDYQTSTIPYTSRFVDEHSYFYFKHHSATSFSRLRKANNWYFFFCVVCTFSKVSSPCFRIIGAKGDKPLIIVVLVLTAANDQTDPRTNWWETIKDRNGWRIGENIQIYYCTNSGQTNNQQTVVYAWKIIRVVWVVMNSDSIVRPRMYFCRSRNYELLL